MLSAAKAERAVSSDGAARCRPLRAQAAAMQLRRDQVITSGVLRS